MYFWYYTSTFNGRRRVGATTFFSTSVCTRSVTTWGVERMSWRRYVFLHRIHPHSILIGFFFLRRKKRGNREVRGGMNHEGVEGGSERAALGFHLHLSSYAVSPLWPSQWLHTAARIYCTCTSASLRCYTGSYWALSNNGAADIPSVLDKTTS